jgi:hypothetical protein
MKNFLDLGTRLDRVVSFTPLPFYHRGKQSDTYQEGKTPESTWPVSRPKFEPPTFRIKVRNVTD